MVSMRWKDRKFIFLSLFVLFPQNLGEYTLIWKLKARCFNEEYSGLRSGYFISEGSQKEWRRQTDILFIYNDHDAFRITEVYLRTVKGVAVDAEELLDTIAMIRFEYISALQRLSEAEYQKVCGKIHKTIISIVIM